MGGLPWRLAGAERTGADLTSDSKLHKAVIVAGDECVQCGACVVQCLEDALVFAYPDGRTIPPDEIRRYKLNMLGERVKAA